LPDTTGFTKLFLHHCLDLEYTITIL
jgi:hypothetical protein